MVAWAWQFEKYVASLKSSDARAYAEALIAWQTARRYADQYSAGQSNPVPERPATLAPARAARIAERVALLFKPTCPASWGIGLPRACPECGARGKTVRANNTEPVLYEHP